MISPKSRQTELEWIAQTDPGPARAWYYIKEGVRIVFKLSLDDAAVALNRWMAWAQRTRMPEFVQ